MTSDFSSKVSGRLKLSGQPQLDRCWPSFEEILQRLHAEGIYLHPHQLAEFLLRHGLPVDLQYVPKHLRLKAIFINENYRGDMARLIEESDYQSSQFPWLN